MFRTLADFSAKTCKFILSKISQVKVRTRSNTKIYATAWKITKDIIWEIVMRRNSHAAVYLRMINQFQELVYLRK